MAEGILRKLDSSNEYQALSAGTEETFVRPLAIQAMQDWGQDISHQTSKTLDRYLQEDIFLVVTVCDSANQICPHFPKAQNRLHWSFPDPSKATGSLQEQLDYYKGVRDQIAERIQKEIIDTSTLHSYIKKRHLI